MAATSMPGGAPPGDTPRGVPSTLVEVLISRASVEGDRVACTFLLDGEGEEQRLTYGELDRGARAIAAAIGNLVGPGQRVLLLYPPGLDFVSAFFGCLYAGVVAVPTYPPDPARLERTVPRLQAVAADAQVAAVLTTREIMEMAGTLSKQAVNLESLDWLATDTTSTSMAHVLPDEAHSPEALAYVQYTSGSTAQPCGVMVSHANLLGNLAVIEECFEHTRESRAVIWLPPYHDMGLVGGLLQPLYVGFPVTLLSPFSFLQRPLRWLQAISRYRAEVSGGPNFAYELCVRKIDAEHRKGLDLSSWRVAFSGAEPVHADTLDRFVKAFGPCGFRREAFYPCYGLAEATLIVSGGSKHAVPVVRNLERRALERGGAIDTPTAGPGAVCLVGSGHALRHETILVVDPGSCVPCLPGRVGEIWVSGPSVALGYWNRPEETERVFHARLAGSGGGTFLRTGDLGFMLDGELFVTGRLKDLIIIRGRNLSPLDVELTVGRSHPGLRPGCGAAFSVEVDNQELLVVAHEIDDSAGAQLQEATDSIRREVAEVHGVEVSGVVLMAPHEIPKTSSGKVQRRSCRDDFLAGRLRALHEWRDHPLVSPGSPSRSRDHLEAEWRGMRPSAASAPPAESIQDWLISWLARELGVRIEDIDVRQPFSFYGLGSAAAVVLCGDLEDSLGRRLSPTLLYEHPTVEALARHLSAGSEPAAAATEIRVRGSTEFEPVAITGIGCRFPGAEGPEAFWELLREGRDAITRVPAARRGLCTSSNTPVSALGGISEEVDACFGGFLDQVDRFDYSFFEISPREAARMDPQQRLLLEVAWEALEDAGQPPDRLSGTPTGVFVGISTNDYGDLQLHDHTAIDGHGVTGNASSIAANRLSYALDLRGPSMAVDTACSSSLVAVHLACQSLQIGECGLALAGGVNVILSPAVTEAFSRAGIIASDGHCKAFDARADGYVRSEGVGIVVLKLLSKAVADGDSIHAVIRGSAVGQDGRTNGMMAPSPTSQAAVLREAYRRAGVSPGEVQYVEAHGTGTFLGDPIEAEALGAVLAVDRLPGNRCAIGSVKTNIGHLEAAAGIAGLIKVALSLEHRTIPPSLHFREPNPHIFFAVLPLRVQQTLEPWPAARGPRLAGVSSFGFGGTNTHVVLEEGSASGSGGENRTSGTPDAACDDLDAAPGSQEATTAGREAASVAHEVATGAEADPSGDQEALLSQGDPPGCDRDARGGGGGHGSGPTYLLPLSARTPESLRSLAEAYRQGFLGETYQTAGFLDLCYTASTRRSHHEHRLAVLARTREEFSESLGAFVKGEVRVGTFTGRLHSRRRHKMVFVFPGQGPKWWPLARELMAGNATFHGTVEGCDKLLRERANISFLERLTADEDFCRGRDSELTQAAFFAVQVGLAALWRSWGVEPDAVVGHSVGEVAAAHVAGALGLEDAVRVVSQRGRVIRRVAGEGGMAVVELSLAEAREEVAPYEGRISVAAINSPISTVLSGELAALVRVSRSLQARGVFCRSLESVDFASHSPQMVPLQRELERDLAGVEPCASLIPIVSTVTGQPCDGRDLDARYWARNLREPVLFFPAVDRLVEDGHDVFLEISPHPALVGAIRTCLAHRENDGTVLASLRRGEEGRETMLGTVGALYALGYAIDWRGMYPARGRAVRLPLYPWQRERCWLERGEALGGGSGETPRPVTGKALSGKREVTVGAKSPRAVEAEGGQTLHGRCGQEVGSESEERLGGGPSNTLMGKSRTAVAGESGKTSGSTGGERVKRASGGALGSESAETPGGSSGKAVRWEQGCKRQRVLNAQRRRIGGTAGSGRNAAAGERILEPRTLAAHGEISAHEKIAVPEILKDLLYEPCWKLTGQLRPNPAAVPLPRLATQGEGVWLIFTQKSGVGKALEALLEARGQSCVLVFPGGRYERAGRNRCLVAPDSLADFERLMAEAFPDGGAVCRGVVHMWSLEADPSAETTPAALDAALEFGCTSVFYLVQAMARTEWGEVPRLWLVTRGAQAVSGDTEIAVAQSPLWGLGRVISQEHPEFRCTRLDLSPGGNPKEGGALLDELLSPYDEDEIAFREGGRYVHRLVRYRGEATSGAASFREA